MTTERDHHISRTKIHLRIGEATIIIHDRLQHHDKIQFLRTREDNPDQTCLILQCLTDLETETQAIIYPTTRSFQPPRMGISQTSFDSLQQTIR